jgi:hypothetical protein
VLVPVRAERNYADSAFGGAEGGKRTEGSADMSCGSSRLPGVDSTTWGGCRISPRPVRHWLTFMGVVWLSGGVLVVSLRWVTAGRHLSPPTRMAYGFTRLRLGGEIRYPPYEPIPGRPYWGGGLGVVAR